MVSLRRRIPTSDKALAFTFGVVFLSIILMIAIFVPNPTGFSYTIFRIVVALAAAGIGAVLPGFLDVSFRNLLRAGGAMALFVIVYFFAPAAIGAPEDVALPSPTQSAMPAAESWLQAIDNGDYQRAYLSMGQMFRERYSQQEMSTLLENERSVLGPAVSRTLNATSNAVNPPGQPRGHYQVYGFRTRFRNEARPIYEAVQLVGEDGVWKVIGFFTYVRTPDGQMVSYEPPETQTQGSDQAESSNSGKEVH